AVLHYYARFIPGADDDGVVRFLLTAAAIGILYKENASIPGAERIFAQQAQGVASKRVGFLPQGRMPVREGAEIVDAQGRAIGKVSSGGFGPSLNAPLAMGYVPSELAGLGSEVTAMVRGKPVTLVVSKMPFVAQRYYRG
ncbi:glycine cleavage T C-terminal barrel domain-containing protein, partial [Pseudomonas aeruginosa]|uniref:glycine cleavage T C-terminal barrel domain-containing protein n=1 Tax=Pseudomonas aeruginosa TaxID=287 RepID=UPI0023E763FB